MDPAYFMRPVTAKQLYQMAHDTQRILEAHGVRCVASGGTLLGAVRNGGIIPWDDDADFSIDMKHKRKVGSARPDFENCGYELLPVPYGYKVCMRKRRRIPGEKHSYPFVDLFFHREGRNGRVSLAQDWATNAWPNDFYLKKEYHPLRLVPFHDISVWIPRDPLPYLKRMYGADWATVGYRTYDHARERSIDESEPITRKVTLAPRDLKAAQPSGKVVKRMCLPS